MSASSSMMTTMNGIVPSSGAVSSTGIGHERRIEERLAAVDRIVDLAVVAREMAHAEPRHQRVTALHLRNAPAQRVRGLLHVRDDGREQMRNALVDRELEHLRIDHDEPHVLGRGLVEQAQHHRVQRDRLTGAGRARDQAGAACARGRPPSADRRCPCRAPASTATSARRTPATSRSRRARRSREPRSESRGRRTACPG